MAHVHLHGKEETRMHLKRRTKSLRNTSKTALCGVNINECFNSRFQLCVSPNWPLRNKDRHTILGPSSSSCDLVQLFDQSPTTLTPHPPIHPILLLLRERLCSPAYIKAKSTPLLPAYCGIQELEDPFPLSHLFSL